MFSKRYLSSVDEARLDEPGVLSVVSFEAFCSAPTSVGIIPVGLESLAGGKAELMIYGDSPASRGTELDCHWSVIDDVCCVATWIDPEACQQMAQASAEAYDRLFKVLAKMGFSHVFRAWNFMPGINSGDADSETYKQFCLGRHQTFNKLGFEKDQYPAASALGHHSEGAVIYLLASKKQSKHIENPRQQSAYEYPRQYGPSSPSFARATEASLAGEKHIFVSGTASIIGHATVAAESIEEQLATTIQNIELLVAQRSLSLNDLSLVRVYLRSEDDFEYTQQFLQQHFAPEQYCILLSDICRANLLVEIEAVALSVA